MLDSVDVVIVEANLIQEFRLDCLIVNLTSVRALLYYTRLVNDDVDLRVRNNFRFVLIASAHCFAHPEAHDLLF